MAAVPVGDSYSCASGGVIAAGRVVAPVIVGNTWTPAKDASGNVLNGNWAQLPMNTWLYADVPVMNSVFQTPAYLDQGGSSGAPNITNAWGGAAWDYTSQKMYFSGGGHGDSSACETGMYGFEVAKLAFSRPRDRDPKTELGYWNSSMVFTPDVELWQGGMPLKSGQPSAVHTYHGVVWVPPAVINTIEGWSGNTSGGVYIPGPTKTVYNLDTRTHSTTHFSVADAPDISDVAAVLDGAKIYIPHNYYSVARWDMSQRTASLWSSDSLGSFTKVWATQGLAISSNSVWGWLRERREYFGFYGYSGLPKVRVRYGAALDASQTAWSPYSDNITLTSSDGSHADFSVAVDLQIGGKLYGAGHAYDHASGALYIVPNTSGSLIYKITGIATNTWTTEKLTGTGVLTTSINGTFGRLQMATLAGKKILIRVSSTLHKPQVMRIS